MRILYASDVDPNPNSGAAGTDLQTIKALELCGHQVDTLWRTDFSQRVRHPGLHSLLELPWSMHRSIAAACAKASYDAVIANQPFAFFSAKRFRTRPSRPLFVIRSHGWEANWIQLRDSWHRKLCVRHQVSPKSLIRSALDYWVQNSCGMAARFSDGLLVNSTLDKSFIEQEYGLRSDRVACVAQAPPDDFLATPVVPLTKTRLPHLLLIGPVQFHKGSEFFVSAAHELMTKHSALSLTWVCPPSDMDYLRASFSPSFAARLTLIPYGTQRQLMQFMDRCGLFVFPSLFEGFGKSPLEAMARGLCVVSSRVGGMVDLIDDGRDGVLVPPGDVRALVKAVGDLLDDFPKALSIAESARATAAKYTWQRTGQEISHWLASLERKQDSV